jgi:TonB-dependent receptor
MKTLKPIIILFTLFFSSVIYGQTGNLVGTVSDATTGGSLPGASIIVPEYNIGTITNLDGEFQLLGVPVESHEVRVSFMGYIDFVSTIEVKEGQNTKLDVKLDIESIGLNEVVVTAVMLGQAKAINQQLSADAMVNVVSEDKIKELPDANAAEAIGRLPGITLARSGGEASKVIIRGLEPKFTNVTINGVKLAASSGNDRSTDLSMISTEMLSGVEVYKSPTPDMDGESIGGTVNFSVRKAKSGPQAKFKVANIYNGLRNDFSNYQASAILGNRYFNDKIGIIAQVNSEKINRGTDNVSGDVGSAKYLGVTTPFWNPANMNSTWEDRKRFGGSLNIDYKLNNGGIFFSSFYSRTNRDSYTKKRSYDLSDWEARYKLTFFENTNDVFSNALSGNHVIANTKLNWAAATSTSNSYKNYDLDIDFYQKNAIDSNKLRDYENKFDIPYNYAPPKEIFNLFIDSPDEVRLDYGEFNPDTTFERNTSFKLDWEIPFKLGSAITGSIKTGGMYRIIDRWNRKHKWKSPQYYLGADAQEDLINSYGGGDFILTSDGRISMANFIENNYTQDEFMSGDYDFYYPLDKDLVNEIYEKDNANWGYYASTAKQDEYSAYERLAAGYLMAKINIYESITIIPGVRLEHSNNDYMAYQTESGSSQAAAGANAIERKSNMKYLVVLPHLHVKYKPTNWFDARLAINKTIGRPQYNQVKPSIHENPNGAPQSITAGNTDLRPTLSTNYDFSVSFYKGTLGLISAGVFYKDIKDDIYIRNKMILRTDSIAEYWGFPDKVDYSLTTFDNKNAKAYGFEIELQAVLKFLPSPFNGIVVSANYTKQFSETLYQTARDTILVIPPTGGNTTPTFVTSYAEEYRTGPMEDQTPNLFNFSLGYDYKGFSCRFSGIFQGTRISTVDPKSDLKDVYTYRSLQLDASLRYTFLKKYSVFANFNNISNRVDLLYKYDDPSAFTTNKQYGYSIITGIQINL